MLVVPNRVDSKHIFDFFLHNRVLVEIYIDLVVLDSLEQENVVAESNEERDDLDATHNPVLCREIFVVYVISTISEDDSITLCPEIASGWP